MTRVRHKFLALYSHLGITLGTVVSGSFLGAGVLRVSTNQTRKLFLSPPLFPKELSQHLIPSLAPLYPHL
ncbi:unnamed protein product [Closterium sp. NIES-54]